MTSTGTPHPASPDTYPKPDPYTTREGWDTWVNSLRKPPRLTDDPAALTPTQRRAYDDERLDFLGDDIIVNTATLQRALNIARRLAILNRRQKAARRGVMINGRPGTGKTTTLTMLGRIHELKIRSRQTPGEAGATIPVIYVTVPYAARPKMLAMEFARFLGLPIAHASRANVADVTEAVCQTLCDARCQLVLVDELQNISLQTQVGSEVSDHLKYFAERIPATFVYAGFDLIESGMFDGPRGRQIATRFTMVEARKYHHQSSEQCLHWQKTIQAFEKAMPLHRHQKGTLSGWDVYLYQRTGGMIGSLSQLIRGAAAEAILDGSEQITRHHLDAVELDLAAEQHYAGHVTEPGAPNTRFDRPEDPADPDAAAGPTVPAS